MIVNRRSRPSDWESTYGCQMDDDPEKFAKNVMDIMAVTNIPERFQECTLEQIPDCDHKEQLVDWRDQILPKFVKGKGLLLHGEVGSGKTGAAVSMAKEVMLRHGMVWYAADLDLDGIFKDKQNKRHQNKILDNQYLILDDLGSGLKSDFGQHLCLLERIIRHRYNAMLPTFITTNLSTIEIHEKLGKASMSVLRAMCDFIEVAETNWRVNE